MIETKCRKCGALIIDEYVEYAVPVKLSRELLTRSQARALYTAGYFIVGLYVKQGRVVDSVIWRPEHDDKWRPVMEHECEGAK